MNLSERNLNREKIQPSPAQPEVPPAEDEIDLFDYIEVIVRRRWLIFWAVVICALASFGYGRSQRVFYRAEVNVLPSQERNLDIDAKSAGIIRHSGYLETLKGTSTRRSMLERAVPRTAESQSDSVRLRDYFGRNNIKQALDGLSACSEFNQDAAGVITIVVTLEDPAMAAGVANAYVEELILFYTEKQQKQVKEDLNFIETRMKTVEAELRVVEDSLVAFQLANVSIQDPQLSLQRSRIQRQVNLKASLYSTLANQYELARIKARKEVPIFEVLNYARVDDTVMASNRERTVLLGAAVGLFVSVFLTFFLEYIERNRQSGRMEPILNELREDAERVRRLLGKGN